MQAEHILQERYRLNQQLGQNASRQTWLATDIQSSPPSPVIIKLLAFNPQMQWDDLKLFEREAQVLKNITHPKIPQYRDYFSVDDVEGSGLRWFGLIQEYIPGKSLKHKRFTEEGSRSIATQVLQILIALHELNPPVLHRDIKPSNLILGKDNQIYLVDFGAVQDKAKAEGATFTVVGTSGYAPPEQLWGKAVPASDIYALGATLIHLLTGISPAELPQNQMRIQFKDRVTINPEFANWIEQLIQPAPERRFSTARQALEALQAKNSTNFKNENVTEKDAPNYAAGFLLTFLIGSGFFLITTVLLSPISPVDKPKQSPAKNKIGALNRAQQAVYLENGQFTTDLTVLGMDINTDKANYRYSIRTTDNGQAVLNYALSKNSALKSYVGIIGTTLGNTATSEALTVAIACESYIPTTLLPEPNKDKSGAIKLECPKGYKDLSRSK
jgi:serine/threonine protein kinase